VNQQEPLTEKCREVIDLIVVGKIRFKATVKEKLAEAYLSLKQKQYEKPRK
jgi:hypothetical protein